MNVFFEIHDHMVMASRTALIADVQPFTTPSLKQAFDLGVKASMQNDPPVSPVDPILNM